MVIISYIYKITNDINNKVYIGKTNHIDPQKRWKEHLNDYKSRKCEKRPLYAAMNKYGEEHFYFEVIEETDSPEEREVYWIEKLRTYVGFDDCNGYNATLGGDGKSYLNLNEDEVIKYYKEEACYLIKRTADYFNVNSNTIKGILIKNNVPYLKPKDAIRMFNYITYGGVILINIKNKNIEHSFENTKEASEYLNISIKKIRSSCSHDNIEKHYIKQYFICYGVDYIKYQDLIDKNYKYTLKERKHKKHKQHKKNKEHKEYVRHKKYNYQLIYNDLLNTKNLSKTIDNLKLNKKSDSCIRRMLTKLDYDLSFLGKEKEIIQRDRFTKEVINEFSSISMANIHFNKDPYNRNISSCLNGKTKTAYGYIWEYK